MNARFWVWWNDDWVKLTLRPNISIRLYELHETDEGYSFQSKRFEHAGDILISECVSGGRDCDGPIKRHSIHECSLHLLRTFGAEPQAPSWQRINAWQRDAYAEAAGY